MRRLNIRHLTRYGYPAPVTFGPHRLLLRPRDGHDIRVESSRLEIAPAHSTLWHRDVYDNSVAQVSFESPGDDMSILSEVVIEHYEGTPEEFPLEPYASSFPFQYDPQERVDLAPCLQPLFASEDEALRLWVEEFWSAGQIQPTLDLVKWINREIPARFGYERREEPGVKRPSQTFVSGVGSCRDLATLFIESCRHMGLAARFVSGYLHAPDLPAAAGATHAWSEVYLPGAGWRGFDSTTGDMVGGNHIAVAVSRHPELVPPVSGSFEGELPGPPSMEVEVQVSEL